MKAIIRENYGNSSILQLKETERPEPAQGQVLIRVLASGVNKADLHLLTGKPFPIRLMAGLIRPKYKILGADVCGIVERIGPGGTQFKPGMEVYGDLSASGFGSFAEFAIANEKALNMKPSGIGYKEAASTPMAAITALQGLRDHGKLKTGEKVLVIGAAGGVGSFAIQMAEVLGAQVSAVCGTSSVSTLQKMGVPQVFDYQQKDITSIDQRFDLIFDTAGKYPLSKIRKLLEPGGRYISSVFSPSALLTGLWFSSISDNAFGGFLAKTNQADLQYLGKLLEEGKLKPLIHKTYTLDDVPEALSDLSKGRITGKLVITI
ncbi:NAD(P)-dependent alcohol dehydrogenase [Jiulongibacter sediminis]|uniref:NAD(P)-dependent alcohol dehydrogenase n=1 Tax=Jiulongibacter sediminis TaxID=1605367 RepID=UPI0026F008A3|nr:NAD(P)-dependent alcohol dehydrogenase [Jiulongibacter sediminis]